METLGKPCNSPGEIPAGGLAKLRAQEYEALGSLLDLAERSSAYSAGYAFAVSAVVWARARRSWIKVYGNGEG